MLGSFLAMVNGHLVSCDEEIPVLPIAKYNPSSLNGHIEDSTQEVC